jgi:hypothetical protein
MALGLYQVKAQVTLTPGTFTLDAASGLRFGTGSYADAASTYGSSGVMIVPVGTLIEVDPAGHLGVALGGAGNLLAVTRGQETGGVYGTAN